MTGAPTTWLVLAAAAHLGFQLTVSVLVYPGLADLPRARWAEVHAAHSRRIVPLVAATYLGLLVALTWSLTSYPGDPGVVLAALGAAGSMGLTAAVAAPLHGRLGRGHDAGLVRRLVLADRVRSLCAAVCLVGAVLAR